MSFRIERNKRERDSNGNYQYLIFEGKRLIAKYWHDFRGDSHGIEFVNGKKEGCPGSMTSFLSGGGPKPLLLTEKAINYLNERKAN
jgi:hypothetical protein